MSELSCPGCGELLSVLPAARGSAHRCAACAGVWLDPAALTALGGTLPYTLERRPSLGDRTCPRCARGLALLRSPEIELDQCEGCRGLFLDAGELATLRSVRERISRQAASAGAEAAASGASAVQAVALLEFLLDLAGVIFDLLSL